MEIKNIDDVISVEPRVMYLLETARKIKDAGWSDYTSMKIAMSSLVGWDAECETLRTSRAYEIAINALCDALNI